MKQMYFDRESRTVADLVEIEPGCYLMTRINVPKTSRGRGLASTLLKDIVEDADEEGATLEIHPMASGRLTRKELVSWYMRYGFGWGRSRIEPGDPIEVLVREPKE